MAALSTTLPTLVDMTKLTAPDGRELATAEVLTQTNDMLDQMTFIEANNGTTHIDAVRTSIPTPGFRKYNQGVQPSKATQDTLSVGMAMIEDYSEADKALADLNGNTNRYRANQDRAKLQGFNNKAQTYLLYGNSGTEPEAFSGFFAYYNTVSSSNSPLYENVINAAGSGTDNTSILLVVWGGEGSITGLYPKGSKAGLQVNDKGQVTIENANGVTGARMEAYRTHYKWDLGLFLGDWRQAVRIANIDKSDLTVDAATGANLPSLMYQAMELVNDLGGGRPAFYMSRRTRMFLRQQITNKVGNSTLTMTDVGGKMITKFGGDYGIPLGRIDAMAADEARVI